MQTTSPALIDYEKVFKILQGNYLLMLPDLTIVSANDAYLKINEQLGDKSALAHGAYTLGYNLQTMGNDVDALKYFKQGVQAAKQSGDKAD